jgi:hypothetical protein
MYQRNSAVKTLACTNLTLTPTQAIFQLYHGDN